MIDPNAKLYDVLDLKLGTVINDINGTPHVFMCMRLNTESVEFWFQSKHIRHWTPSTYSLVRGGFAKFPDLVNYLKPEFR